MTKRPRLLVLDDHEGRVATAPAMARLRELAKVTVLDRPLEPGDLAGLADVRVLLPIREGTRLDGAFFDRLPNLERVADRRARVSPGRAGRDRARHHGGAGPPCPHADGRRP